MPVSDDTTAQAREFASALEEAARSRGADGVVFSARAGEGVTVTVPGGLADLVLEVIGTVSRGGAITVRSIPEELTTTTAAHLLGVSRPTLMKMIKRGELPAHRVGSHTRLRCGDVLGFMDQQRAAQRQAFEELRAFEDEHDITG
ncbi:helix-turn-helix domain-containing protein [Hoyosella sp. YIM 151337]|nr:helix-turn-helix domain-containing protein [Hoyosella sp. YIM 151337]MCW4355227.1 helix-turn-helix domain-containing protein [Hoyosella sp. YIM 151337]